jgi:hypothetical protein
VTHKGPSVEPTREIKQEFIYFGILLATKNGDRQKKVG